jgi:F-box/leucine-rich repeat protein 10/11
MSAMNSFTDFHVDLGGTSVWYHVVHGAKVFIVVKPTILNMRAYAAWVKGIEKGSVQDHFLKFLEKRTSMKNVRNCTYLVHLKQRDTAFIPSVRVLPRVEV